MTTRRRNPNHRRRVGGAKWNQHIDQIRKSGQAAARMIGKINKILTEMHRLFEEKKNLPFVGLWIFQLSNIANGLTAIQTELSEILLAIEEIDEISQAVARERQEALTLIPSTRSGQDKPERKVAG